jgi:exodeoxyribonuclease VII small subunit
MASRKHDRSDPAESGSTSPQSPIDESLSFEQAMAKLQAVVAELEAGDLPLEAAVALYTQGVALSRQAGHKLSRAEQRIDELLHVDEQGAPVTREIESDR